MSGRAPSRTAAEGRLLDRLRRTLGDAHLLVDAAERAGHEVDWTGRFRGTALAVARPADADEVRDVLAICHDAGAPVVPQGGNTGLVGGGVPRDGEVVLSLRRLDAIERPARAGSEVIAAAGVTLEVLQRVADSAGREFGVDFGARSAATVGGMIATNAGGVHVLRHGPMGAQVLGLDVILADGTVIRRLAATDKDNAGYNLSALITGSEGTLGVVTRARLRLVPRLDRRCVAVVGLPDAAAAVDLVGRLHGRLPSLAAAELFFEPGLDLVVRHAGGRRPFGAPAGAYVLVECAAQVDPVDELAAALADEPGVVGSAIAVDPSGRRGLWHLREAHPEAISREGIPHKLDVAVPIARLAEFVAAVEATVTAAAPGARTFLYGHVADGNIHVNVLDIEPDDDSVDDAVLGLVLDLGGTISAEHGIGAAKTGWLATALGSGDVAAMAAIKRALDPRGILNPGVVVAGRPG